VTQLDPTVPDYRPRVPTGSGHGIAILGCGGIARTAHLPAYAEHRLDVVGVWSRSPESARLARTSFPFIGRAFEAPEQLLADPQVDVVDLATRVEHRRHWLEAAVDAGKHVLAQKPLTDAPETLEPVLAKADATGVRIAVNQNARWAPVWRLATLLVQDGAVGEVVGVTHLLDKPLPPITGTHFDDIPHMLISDYLVHWVDITRCWLDGNHVDLVQARDGRVPGQPDGAKNPWTASVQIGCRDGATALIRVVGDARTRTPSCPFWIHGTEGTLRGSILGRDFLSLERGDTTTSYHLEGAWFVDGFAGTMGELLRAVDEDREPYNSARHNLASLRIVAAARASAEQSGAPHEMDLPL
jgi:predicted dehydrogenase